MRTTLCDQHICKFDKFDRMLVNLLNDVRKRTLYQTCNSAGYQSVFEAAISSVPLLVHSIAVLGKDEDVTIQLQQGFGSAGY